MSKNAYVTFLPDDNDIENIISLYYTYKKTNSLYPFIVLYCDNITNKAIKRLQDYGVTLARIPAEKQYKNDEKLGIRKNNLYPFTMVDYDKITYVNWQNQVFLKMPTFYLIIKSFHLYGHGWIQIIVMKFVWTIFGILAYQIKKFTSRWLKEWKMIILKVE